MRFARASSRCRRSCATAVQEIADWDHVKLLTVAVDRLPRWHKPGLICIGDAAHAMSPIGGVGINLAIQDAVAAANILATPLRAGTVTEATLAAIQKRRSLPIRVIQRLQVFMQNNLIDKVLRARAAQAAIPGQALAMVPAVAADSGAPHRHGRAAGARAHTGSFVERMPTAC